MDWFDSGGAPWHLNRLRFDVVFSITGPTREDTKAGQGYYYICPSGPTVGFRKDGSTFILRGRLSHTNVSMGKFLHSLSLLGLLKEERFKTGSLTTDS